MKRLITIFLCLLLTAVLLVGCGQSKKPLDQKDDPIPGGAAETVDPGQEDPQGNPEDIDDSDVPVGENDSDVPVDENDSDVPGSEDAPDTVDDYVVVVDDGEVVTIG